MHFMISLKDHLDPVCNKKTDFCVVWKYVFHARISL